MECRLCAYEVESTLLCGLECVCFVEWIMCFVIECIVCVVLWSGDGVCMYVCVCVAWSDICDIRFKCIYF